MKYTLFKRTSKVSLYDNAGFVLICSYHCMVNTLLISNSNKIKVSITRVSITFHFSTVYYVFCNHKLTRAEHRLQENTCL